MWLLLVAVGSGCLARCWRHGSSQRREELERDVEEEDDDRCPSEEGKNEQVFGLVGDGDGAIAMVESKEEMLKRREKNALQQMDPVAVARRISGKKLFDGEEDHGDTSSKPPETAKTTTITSTTSSSDPPQAAVETSATQLEIDSASPVPVVPAGKRAIEFSKHAMQGDIAGIEVKRKRDSSELVAGQSQEQGLLSSFTCSFMDNPGLTDVWFAPREGDAARIRKAKTPSRQRSRGLGRRARYLRASPKPVSSMESCLSAQLHFDEDKRVSRSLFFQPFEDGRSPGLGEVEMLGTGAAGGSTSGLRRTYAHLPPLLRPFARKNSRKHFKAGGDPSQEALLFSFGIGIGVMHMVTSHKAETERLRKCLAESENLVQVLQRTADHGAVERSTGLDSAGSNLTAEQHGNMAELEAQLEAELELMQLNSTDELDAEVVHSELIPSGLPGVSDFDEDDKNQSHGEGNTTNWAVSPRELDRRLRMLIESRQEERIAQLEEELQHAENQLHDREMELQMWKDRVHRLTGMNLPSSGNNEENVVTHKSTELETAEEDSYDCCKPGEQSPTDDICDEFLKSVFAGGQRSVRDHTGASSCSISECGESWQPQASGTTPENYLSGGGMDNEQRCQHNRNSSTDLEQERKATPPWSYSNVFVVSHAGSTTPIQDVRSSKLFNTPRALRLRNGALVLDKIRYWENLARGSSVKSEAHTPPPETEEEHAAQGNGQSSPPVRFSCSDGSSRDDSSASDTEEGGRGHVLIKRIVEKSRKGSTLLKSVEKMLAALDSE